MKKKKNKKQYFDQEVEDAINDYNNNEDIEVKNKIYQDKIHFAFFKLTQNLIHTFKFYHTEVDNLEDLQHEVIIFLISKMDKFNPDLGYKAFSYFGTIAKRYLIIYNNKNYSKKKDILPIEFIQDDEKHSYTEESYDSKLSYFLDEFTKYCDKNLFKLFPKEQDAKIADAVMEIFRNREKFDDIAVNKKVLYFHIREIIQVRTPKMTAIIDRIYVIFKKEYIFFLENGYLNF